MAVGLAHAWRADEDHVVALVDEPEVQQAVDLALADGGLVAIVKALQMLVRRKACRLVIALYPVGLTLLEFVFSQSLCKAQERHFTGFGLGQ